MPFCSAKQGRRDSAFQCRARQPECPPANGSRPAWAAAPPRRPGPGPTLQLFVMAGVVGSAPWPRRPRHRRRPPPPPPPTQGPGADSAFSQLES